MSRIFDVIIGAGISLLITNVIPACWNYFQSRKHEGEAKFLGTDWYSYNWTNKKGKISLVSYHWEFRRSFFTGKVVAKVTSSLDKKIGYKATLFTRAECVYFWGKGVHKEFVTWLFPDDYPNTESSLYGAFLGLDYFKNPYCGLTIFRDEPLSTEDAIELLETKYEKCKDDNRTWYNLLEGVLDKPQRSK